MSILPDGYRSSASMSKTWPYLPLVQVCTVAQLSKAELGHVCCSLMLLGLVMASASTRNGLNKSYSRQHAHSKYEVMFHHSVSSDLSLLALNMS